MRFWFDRTSKVSMMKKTRRSNTHRNRSISIDTIEVERDETSIKKIHCPERNMCDSMTVLAKIDRRLNGAYSTNLCSEQTANCIARVNWMLMATPKWPDVLISVDSLVRSIDTNKWWENHLQYELDWLAAQLAIDDEQNHIKWFLIKSKPVFPSHFFFFILSLSPPDSIAFFLICFLGSSSQIKFIEMKNCSSFNCNFYVQFKIEQT